MTLAGLELRRPAAYPLARRAAQGSRSFASQGDVAPRRCRPRFRCPRERAQCRGIVPPTLVTRARLPDRAWVRARSPSPRDRLACAVLSRGCIAQRLVSSSLVQIRVRPSSRTRWCLASPKPPLGIEPRTFFDKTDALALSRRGAGSSCPGGPSTRSPSRSRRRIPGNGPGRSPREADVTPPHHVPLAAVC